MNSVFKLLPSYRRGPNHLIDIYAKLVEVMEMGRGAELARGSPWGAYNAFTEYVDHVRRSTVMNDGHLKSVCLGRGDRIKKRAFESAVKVMISTV